MKKLYRTLLTILLVLALGIGFISLVDKDPTVSEEEKRTFTKPKFTLSGLFDGTFIPELEQYYSDTFPGRQLFLSLNKKLGKFYYYSGAGDQSVLIVNQSSGAEQGGESLAAVEQMHTGFPETQQPDVTQTEAQTQQTDLSGRPSSAVEDPFVKPGAQAAQTPQQTEQAPKLDDVDESDASYAGAVVIVGTRAMEVPTAIPELITSYAQAVGNLSEALGPDVRTISLVTPNGAEFYTPESLHTDSHSQKAMIESCYSQMDSSIVTVDAYDAIRMHADEYIYFRTDHHWTQLGAYYAYTAFCKAAGFKAVDLSRFETGRYDNFLGSMYTFTSGYPQSEVLRNNPDYLDYYLPIAWTQARYYADSRMENGVAISVVYTKVADSTTNKYLCFIGGDTPVCVIDTDVDGPICMVLKESYGNAFVPFLTSHYSRIIVIDPREFNQDGKPSLNLAEFAAEQYVDDLIVINYPYMINNKAYIRWLNALAGVQ